MTGSAQPIFGTTATAQANPTYDQFSGNITGANKSVTTVNVSSTNGFRTGLGVLCGTSSTLFLGSPNQGYITNVNTSTSSLIIQGLTASVPSGAYVLLNEEVQTVTISPIQGNAGNIYIGRDWTTASTSPQVFSVITNPPTGTYVFNTFQTPTTDKAHAYNTTEFWVNGTVGDKIIVQYTQG